MTFEKAEKVLLARLEDPEDDRVEALWQLARFYRSQKRYDTSLDYLRQVIATSGDPEIKAASVLAMGQAMEEVGDYEAAVKFYREAFALSPTRTHTWYFINNNLGFSLNTLGRAVEGEEYCRAAIAIDANRPNGHKNLGISLAAQGKYREAALCFVRATQANASDARSLRLLRELLQKHQELRNDFETELHRCEKAVRMAQDAAAAARAAN